VNDGLGFKYEFLNLDFLLLYPLRVYMLVKCVSVIVELKLS